MAVCSLGVLFSFGSHEWDGLNSFFLRFLCVVFTNCRRVDTESLQCKEDVVHARPHGKQSDNSSDASVSLLWPVRPSPGG